MISCKYDSLYEPSGMLRELPKLKGFMMLKDVYNSIKLSIIERTTSPVVGVFASSWLAFNWKVVAYIFWGGDLPLKVRVSEYIEPLLTEQTTFLWWFSIPEHLHGPIWFTFIFSFLYPVASIAPFYVWQKADSWKQYIRNRHEGQQLLSVEQSNKLRREMRSQEQGLNDTIEKYRTERDDAAAEAITLETQLRDLDHNSQVLTKDLEQSKKEHEDDRKSAHQTIAGLHDLLDANKSNLADKVSSANQLKEELGIAGKKEANYSSQIDELSSEINNLRHIMSKGYDAGYLGAYSDKLETKHDLQEFHGASDNLETKHDLQEFLGHDDITPNP